MAPSHWQAAVAILYRRYAQRHWSIAASRFKRDDDDDLTDASLNAGCLLMVACRAP